MWATTTCGACAAVGIRRMLSVARTTLPSNVGNAVPVYHLRRWAAATPKAGSKQKSQKKDNPFEVMLRAVDPPKRSEEVLRQDAKLAQEYNKHMAAKDREHQKKMMDFLRSKWEAINALPAGRTAEALADDTVPIPSELWIMTDTPPIKGFSSHDVQTRKSSE